MLIYMVPFQLTTPQLCGAFGLYADDEIHPRDVRGHFLRQLDKAEVGQAQTGLALTNQIEHSLHGDILDKQRHDAQYGGAFARHVRCDLRRHHPGVVFQSHPVMDDPANFRKGIVAQSRVDLRRDIGCEIPHRPAREQSAQIDRQQNFNGLRRMRRGTFSACRSLMAFIITAAINSVTLTPNSFAFSFTAGTGSMSVVRFRKPSGSGVPLRW